MHCDSDTVVRIKRVGSPEWRASGASCAWLQRSCIRWGAACCSYPPGTCCRHHRRWDWGARCETAGHWCSTPSARDTHSAISDRRDMSQSQSRRRGWHLGDGAHRDENLQVISHEADETSWVVLFRRHDKDVDPCICKASTCTNVSWGKMRHCTVKQLIVNSWMKESFPTGLQGQLLFAQDKRWKSVWIDPENHLLCIQNKALSEKIFITGKIFPRGYLNNAKII